MVGNLSCAASNRLLSHVQHTKDCPILVIQAIIGFSYKKASYSVKQKGCSHEDWLKKQKVTQEEKCDRCLQAMLQGRSRQKVRLGNLGQLLFVGRERAGRVGGDVVACSTLGMVGKMLGCAWVQQGNARL